VFIAYAEWFKPKYVLMENVQVRHCFNCQHVMQLAQSAEKLLSEQVAGSCRLCSPG
jgi:hypothetical protein